jgi:hypothetical protein
MSNFVSDYKVTLSFSDNKLWKKFLPYIRVTTVYRVNHLQLAAIFELTQLHVCLDLYFLLCLKLHHSNLVYMLLSLLLSFPFGDPKGIHEPPLVFHHFSQTVVLLHMLPFINNKDILTSHIHSCVVRCNTSLQLCKLWGSL